MYPGSSYTQPNNDKQAMIKKWLLIGVPILFVLIALATIFWPRPHFEQYKLSRTGLIASQSFGHLHESDLYAYNGLAFYKTNLDNDTTEVLSSGKRLPTPSNIYWADSRGVLMNFSSSFYLSLVEQTLNATGEQMSYDVQNYTWYFDFATSSLKLVSKQSVVPGQAYYSERDKGFYYITDRSEDPHPTTPLYFYSIETNKNETIATDLKVTDVGDLLECPGAERVCFVARDQTDTSNQKLYGIADDGQTKVLLEQEGRLFATNDPARYVGVGRDENVDTEPTEANDGNVEHVDQVDLSEQPAILYDIKANSQRELGFKVGMRQPVVHFNGDQFYVLDSAGGEVSEDEDAPPTYYSGNLTGNGAQTTTFPMTYSNEDAFESQITSTVSHGGGAQTLVNTIDNRQLLFSSAQNNTPSLAPQEFKTIDEAVKGCISSGALESQYFGATATFRIYFTSDDSFYRNIASFSECVLQSDSSPMHGYNFHFAGRDPVNGRISTD